MSNDRIPEKGEIVTVGTEEFVKATGVLPNSGELCTVSQVFGHRGVVISSVTTSGSYGKNGRPYGWIKFVDDDDMIVDDHHERLVYWAWLVPTVYSLPDLVSWIKKER